MIWYTYEQLGWMAARGQLERQVVLFDGLSRRWMRADSMLQAFARWSDRVDAGEAEAIAVATSRKWVVGLDDLFAQRRLTSESGPGAWVNSATLLVSAVREKRLYIFIAR